MDPDASVPCLSNHRVRCISNGGPLVIRNVSHCAVIKRDQVPCHCAAPFSGARSGRHSLVPRPPCRLSTLPERGPAPRAGTASSGHLSRRVASGREREADVICEAAARTEQPFQRFALRAAVDGLPDRSLVRSQISVCSAISRASSTSIPRYRTVDSSLECPSNNWTARRFFVRR